MRRILVLLIAMIVCAEMARAGDVTVEAVTTASPGGEETTNFAPDAPELFAMFKTKGAQSGDKLRGVWIAEDVGSAVPANSKIDEKTLTMDGDTDDGDLSLSKPTKGWPVGKYRLEIYVNDKLVTTTRFTIEGNKEEESAESTKSADSAEAADSGDSADSADSADSEEGEYSFTVHNTTNDRITKLLASEDGQNYGTFDVGSAGISPGQTVTLNWDKSTNDSHCKWFIKAVFDDGSETPAKKFDFCEEELELDF
jgi:hypothetical protein